MEGDRTEWCMGRSVSLESATAAKLKDTEPELSQ